EGDQLVARLNRKRPDLYLMPVQDGQPQAELYTLRKDELVPASTRGLYLAESFARQDGWVVADERIRWKDWVKQQGLVERKTAKASHLRRFGDKARALLERARTSLNK
ncbi:MAG: metal ABC transporter ATPase, partial [Pseudomonas alloputida]